MREEIEYYRVRAHLDLENSINHNYEVSFVFKNEGKPIKLETMDDFMFNLNQEIIDEFNIELTDEGLKKVVTCSEKIKGFTITKTKTNID